MSDEKRLAEIAEPKVCVESVRYGTKCQKCGTVSWAFAGSIVVKCGFCWLLAEVERLEGELCDIRAQVLATALTSECLWLEHGKTCIANGAAEMCGICRIVFLTHEIKAENLSTLRQQNAALSAEVEGLRGDKGRLDGLLRLATTAPFERIELHYDIDEGGLWELVIPDVGAVTSFTNTNPRALIDAAIASEPGHWRGPR